MTNARNLGGDGEICKNKYPQNHCFQNNTINNNAFALSQTTSQNLQTGAFAIYFVRSSGQWLLFIMQQSYCFLMY